MFDRLFIFLLVAICYTSLKNVRLEYNEQCFPCNFTIVYKPRKLSLFILILNAAVSLLSRGIILFTISDCKDWIIINFQIYFYLQKQ